MIQLLPVLSGIMWGAAGVFVRIFTELGMNSLTIVESRVIPAVSIIFTGLFIIDKKLLRIKFLIYGYFSVRVFSVCWA